MTDDKTKYVDRAGRTIFIGDIIQYRLGSGKSGGAWRLRVIRSGKKVYAVPENTTKLDKRGERLAVYRPEHLVVVESKYIK